MLIGPGKSFRKMAAEVGMSEWYDFMYQIYSDVTHSGVGAAKEYVLPIPTGGVIMTPGLFQQIHAEACLRVAYMCLWATFEVANDFLNMEIDDHLDEAQKNLTTVLPEY